MPDINTDKVCYVIAKARELESEDEGVEADASNPSDDNFISVMTDDAFASIRAELASGKSLSGMSFQDTGDLK